MVEVNGFQRKWETVERTPGSVLEMIDVLVDRVSDIELESRRLRDESDGLRSEVERLSG
jgi:hypothetical protein